MSVCLCPGYLKDATGTWHGSYMFAGLSILAGVVVLLLDPVAVRHEERKLQRLEQRQQQQLQQRASSDASDV